MVVKRLTVGIALTLLALQVAACSPSAQNIEGEKWIAFSGKQAEWVMEPGLALAYRIQPKAIAKNSISYFVSLIVSILGLKPLDLDH